MMWVLMLHGGASEILPEKEKAFREGCGAALAAGAEALRLGQSAVDAVEATVRVLEADPTFNAGYGSALNAEGEVEMCAAVMEGRNFDVGAVSAVKGVRHPVSVARRLLEEETILLTADGARSYAREHGLETCDPAELESPERAAEEGGGGHDTVGAIAVDAAGRIAVATSTGGIAGSPAGRVGDSPQPGCGYYADRAVGAVAFSGDGEHIARMMLAARVMHRIPEVGPEQALAEALAAVERIGGEAGGIVVTAAGEIAWAHNSANFAVACQHGASPGARIYLSKREEQDHAVRQGQAAG
jgi:L-asparaginase / beta-aspartyl-peptidase